MGTGHLEAERTSQGWKGIGQSSAVEALRTVEGPKEALGVRECQEVSLSLDLYQVPGMAPGRTLSGPVLLLQPQDTAVGNVSRLNWLYSLHPSSTQQCSPSIASPGSGPGQAVIDQTQGLPVWEVAGAEEVDCGSGWVSLGSSSHSQVPDG